MDVETTTPTSLWKLLHGTALPVGATWQMLLQGATADRLLRGFTSWNTMDCGPERGKYCRQES
eukprot:4032879-Lingulodinium_polyedra.AAC.1